MLADGRRKLKGNETMNAYISPQPGKALSDHDLDLAMKMGMRLDMLGEPDREKQKKEREMDEMDRKYTLSLLLSLLRR